MASWCECARLSLFAGARTFGSWVLLSLPKSTSAMLFKILYNMVSLATFRQLCKVAKYVRDAGGHVSSGELSPTEACLT